ncbi:MAG: hypothetical protein BWK77_04875 [Verrucomicrobia bacterium A1]|nr:MAG: hypothetical protein BWK77_04875 [Verrucomicrobia bacterium A1]
MTANRQESAHAARSAAATLLGNVGSMALGVVSAILVPNVLGSVGFGYWTYYRGLTVVLFSISALVTPLLVFTREFAALSAAGETERAGQLFKAIVLFRLSSAVLFGALGAPLILRGGYKVFGLSAIILLALMVVSRAWMTISHALMYASRQLPRLAVLGLFNTALVPVAVAVGYRVGGVYAIVWSCLIGELLLAVIYAWGSRPFLVWPRGLPSRADWHGMLFSGIAVSAAATAANMFRNAVLAVMGLSHVPAVEIGYVGLGVRLGGVAGDALLSVAMAVFPSAVLVLQQSGQEDVLRWQEHLYRWGTVGLLLMIGVYQLAGHLLVPLVFGAEFAPAAHMVGWCLAVEIPIWIGAQYAILAVLLKRHGVFGASVAGLYVVFFAVHQLLPAAVSPANRAIQAMFAGTVTYAVIGHVGLRVRARVRLNLHPLLVPVVMTVTTFFWQTAVRSAVSSVLIAVLWAPAFLLFCLVSGALQPEDGKLLWRSILRLFGRAEDAFSPVR